MASKVYIGEFIPAYLKYSTPTVLSQARTRLAGAHNDNYALFGGGFHTNPDGSYTQTSFKKVDAYNSSLTRSLATDLAQARWPSGTRIGEFALFGGGQYTYGYGNTTTTYHNTVDAYNLSLTRSNPTGLSVARCNIAATHNNNYALFGGGNQADTLDVYDQSLTRSNPTTLSLVASSYPLAATHINDYMLFTGWYNSTNIDVFDSSLTRLNSINLSQARWYIAGAHNDNYALFGGGQIGSKTRSNVVDAYNSSLTRSNPTGLYTATSNLTGTRIGEFALFGGGYYCNVVNAYDASLTRSKLTDIGNQNRSMYMGGAHVGNYAIFAGGSAASGNETNLVNAYENFKSGWYAKQIV